MMVVFDTMTFRGVNAGEALAKRNWDDSAHPHPHAINLIYDPESEALVRMHHAPHLVAEANVELRKRGETQLISTPVAGNPPRDNFGLNVAAGSTDSKGGDSANAGDHALRRFPETYSAPLTLDPIVNADPNEPTVYKGELVTGTPPKFCDIGDIGCTCRATSAANRCDKPYECNTLGYCVRPACPVGSAGCAAFADNTCTGTLVNEDGNCVYASTCEAGKLGCVCDASSACSTGSCLDNLCVHKKLGVADVCVPGESGCSCTSTGACNSGTSCDGFSGLCVFESCKSGARGCKCAKALATKCEDGFVCSGKGSCVESKCTPGAAGCKCLTNKKCSIKGFKCIELNREGTLTACVGEELCPGLQQARCDKECGPGNVAVCGKCTYSQPICRDMMVQYCNKESYLYGVGKCTPDNGTSTLAIALVALLAAIAAMF